jgi:hypothetical protein
MAIISTFGAIMAKCDCAIRFILALKQEKTIAKSIFLKPASHNIGRL